MNYRIGKAAHGSCITTPVATGSAIQHHVMKVTADVLQGKKLKNWYQNTSAIPFNRLQMQPRIHT